MVEKKILAGGTLIGGDLIESGVDIDEFDLEIAGRCANNVVETGVGAKALGIEISGALKEGASSLWLAGREFDLGQAVNECGMPVEEG